MAHNTLLALKERWLIHSEDVIDPGAIKSLHTIHLVEIEGIVRGVGAGRLDEGSSPQCFAKGKVLLQGQAPPIIHAQGNEAGVVITVADAGVDSNAAGQLTRGRGSDGTVQHAAAKVESRTSSALVESRP